MFWSLRENLCGLNHMGRLAGRLLLGRRRLYYVESLKARGFAVEPVLDDRGEPLNCRLCGFANLRFDLTPGFEMTYCSALSLSVILHQDKLKLWSQDLPRSSKEALDLARLSANREGLDAPADPAGAVVKGSPEAESVV
jgi:hypothetical protein